MVYFLISKPFHLSLGGLVAHIRPCVLILSLWSVGVNTLDPALSTVPAMWFLPATANLFFSTPVTCWDFR